MRWLLLGRLATGKSALAACVAVTLLLCCMLRVHAQSPGAQRSAPAIVLEDGSRLLRDPPPGLQWTDRGGSATLAQVVAGRGAFEPLQADRIHRLGPADALWFQLRVTRPATSHMEWVAEIPLPPLDSVTLFQQDGTGAWRGQSAGDRIPVAAWPEPGRFPVFRLEVPPGESRDIYFRVQHNARSNIPLRIASVANHGQRMQLAYLALGLVFGALVLLVAACLTQSYVYRDRAFFGYAAYVLIMALAIAAYTGAGAHLLWPRSAYLGDHAQGGFSLLSAAAAILFVRDLSGIAGHSRRLASIARALAFAAPVLLLVYLIMERPAGSILLGIYLTLSSVLNLVVALRAWRAGDKVSPWLVAAYVPMGAGILLTLLRIFGFSSTSWANQYGLVAAMAIQVPLLVVALSIHSRERHGAITRELALSRQDALTGLLASHLFHDRLRQVVARHRRAGESAAVLFVDLANYPRIREQYGSGVAEQSLLRSVIKLRRLLRETDTLSRIGESRFGLILERMASRVTVTDRAARVIAAAMLPIPGQKPEVSLQFHVAAALLDEVDLAAPELTSALAGLLDSMGVQTRRPIRFLGSSAPDAAAGPDSLSPLGPGPEPVQ